MVKRVCYFCEYCGVGYSDEQSAVDCEESHIKPTDIHSVYNTGEKYPTALKMVMEDGSVVNFISEITLKQNQNFQE